MGWNESSRRYVTETPEFYIPGVDEWRAAPENRKQGSGNALSSDVGALFTEDLIRQAESGIALYEKAMESGIAAEQARLFLPAYALYVRWRWTASLGAVVHFLQQRLEHDAQKEIFWYAEGVRDLLKEHFPVTVGAIFE
jgi:thymidylate synthase (FAD)